MPTTEDKKSRIEQGYEDGFNNHQNAYANAGIDQLEALANDPEAHKDDSVKDAEANPMNYNPRKTTSSTKKSGGRLKTAKTFFKKKGSIIGIVSVLGVTGLGVGVLGPGSLLMSLMQNFTNVNDSSSRVMNRFTPRVLNRMAQNPGDDGGVCSSTKKTIKCRGSQISNKALKNLNKRGITPMRDGKPMDIKRTGYPKGGNPTSYMIDGKEVPAANLKQHLIDNPRTGAKVFGIKGILNMKARAWSGKMIKNSFYKIFNLKKDGGIADGKNKKSSNMRERFKAAMDRFKSKIPGLDKMNNLKAALDKKIGPKMKKAGGRGGMAYSVAYATCVASKAPSIVSAGVAGVQLMRLLPIANDLVLSPGGKLQMSGVDPENQVTPEDMATAGSILTNKTPDSNGKMTSALDSPLLLAALGVNKNKISPATYGKYIPGYEVLNNPVWAGLRQAQKDMAPGCAVIMNPITMYIFLAAESLLTKTNPAGAILGFVGGFVVSWVAGDFVAKIMQDFAQKIITELAGADVYKDLQGIELGHALGASALAFFSAGSMARFIPALSVNQLSASEEQYQQDIARERAMDIASLSPLDTSSQYTFLGSIVHSMRINAITHGGYTNGVTALASSVFNLPGQSLSGANASASDGLTKAQCDNADAFDLTPDPKDGPKPAINPIGMPCTDLLSNMTYEQAEAILIQKGWLDDTKAVPEGAMISDLVTSEVITKKEGNVLRELTAGDKDDGGSEGSSCSDASTGNYLFDMAGCTLNPNVHGGGVSGSPTTCTRDSNDKETCTTTPVSGADNGNDAAAHEAVRVWLISYQIAQSINGEDDDTGSGGGSTSSPAAGPMGKIGPNGWAYPLDSPKTLTTYAGHTGDDIETPIGSNVYAIREGKVTFSGPQYQGGRPSWCPGFASWIPPQYQIHIQSTVDGVPYEVIYAHLSADGLAVKAGDTVKTGQMIAKSGNTGCTSGPHLHLEINNGAMFPRDIFGASF